MKILVAGGSGFVGHALINELKTAGHTVTIVTRNPAKVDGPAVGWQAGELTSAMGAHDAVINLVGEPVLGKRWSVEQKNRLRESRVDATKRLVDAMARSQTRPRCLVNSSAIGFYGPRGEESLAESDPGGHDFLAEMSKDWEKEAFKARELGVRTAVVRTGIVLGRGGGALGQMLTPFKLGLGGTLGDGRQVMSWIHIQDLARLFLFLLENERAEGVFNGTAPHPATNREFTKTLGKVLKRPTFFPVPGLVLRLVFGEVGEIMLTGQRVVPQRALEAGFAFRFPDLEGALRDLVI